MTVATFVSMLGLALYLWGGALLGPDARVPDVGRIAFAAGLLAWLLDVGARALFR